MTTSGLVDPSSFSGMTRTRGVYHAGQRGGQPRARRRRRQTSPVRCAWPGCPGRDGEPVQDRHRQLSPPLCKEHEALRWRLAQTAASGAGS